MEEERKRKRGGTTPHLPLARQKSHQCTGKPSETKDIRESKESEGYITVPNDDAQQSIQIQGNRSRERELSVEQIPQKPRFNKGRKIKGNQEGENKDDWMTNESGKKCQEKDLEFAKFRPIKMSLFRRYCRQRSPMFIGLRRGDRGSNFAAMCSKKDSRAAVRILSIPLRTFRSSGRYQRYLGEGIRRGSRCVCCAAPGHPGSRVGCCCKDHHRTPHTAVACHYNTGCHHRKHRCDGLPTCDSPPRPRTDWLQNTPTRRSRGRDGCPHFGCWLLPPEPRLGPQLAQSLQLPVRLSIGSCRHSAWRHGGSQARFRLRTWPAQLRHC